MAKLLLEFNKNDLEDVLKDQTSFTVAYEIELDTDNESIWGFKETPDLSELVPEDDKLMKVSDLFSELSADSFYQEQFSIENDVGKLFGEWLKSLPVNESTMYLVRIANAYNLLDAEYDEDWIDEFTLNYYHSAFNALESGDSNARKALAKVIIENENLKDYLESTLEIVIPDKDQVDLFGEDSKLEAIANLIFSNLREGEYRKFIKNIFKDSWGGKMDLPHRVDFIKFIKEYVNYSDDLNPDTADDSEEDQENKENINQINNLVFSDGFLKRAYEEILPEIERTADQTLDMDDFYNFSINTFALPSDIESEFDDWVYSEFENYRSLKEQEIGEEVYLNLEEYFDIEDYDPNYGLDPEYGEYEIERVVEEYFPNFYQKWGDILTYDTDMSLDNGFEIYPTSYISSLEEAFEFLEDFYDDYDNQSAFSFTGKTGLHTNIGIVDGVEDNWNYFKGFLFLNDNFATRGFEDRMRSRWSQSIRDAILNKVRRGSNISNFRKAAIAAVKSNFPAIEKAMNDILEQTSDKSHGFSIRDNRIEFRYPGGDVSFDDLRAATLYYAYIVKLTTDPNFKRKEYLKRATAFALGITEEIEKADYSSFMISGDGEIKTKDSINAIKNAIENNPNPEPMFKMDHNSNIPGFYFSSMTKLLEPEKLSIDTSSGFDIFTKEYESPYYFTIKEVNESASTVIIEGYRVTYGSPILEITDDMRGWGRNRIYPIYIIKYESNVPLYAVGNAISRGQIEPVSTENYAKIKLFQKEELANEQLARIVPWFSNAIKAREIIDSSNSENIIVSQLEFENIKKGNFDMLINRLRGAA